jgi:hypothetical protein
VRTQIFQAIGWIAARHIAHYEAVKVLVANIGAIGLRLADPKQFSYYEQVQCQADDLQELRALNGALAIKELADRAGGWEDHHGIGLNMVASVLIEQHDWDPQDVNDWVRDLTDGFFNFGEIEG